MRSVWTLIAAGLLLTQSACMTVVATGIGAAGGALLGCVLPEDCSGENVGVGTAIGAGILGVGAALGELASSSSRWKSSGESIPISGNSSGGYESYDEEDGYNQPIMGVCTVGNSCRESSSDACFGSFIPEGYCDETVDGSFGVTREVYLIRLQIKQQQYVPPAPMPRRPPPASAPRHPTKPLPECHTPPGANYSCAVGM